MALPSLLRCALALLALCAASTHAATADTQAACAAIKTAYPDALAYPTDSTYAAGRKYWSGTAADAGTPACIFYPTSAQAVRSGVAVLLKYPSVQFAMKSGGHSPNPGFNNVDGGVLFAFSSLANTVLSADKTTADVGPGARWEQVITALEPYGKAVVGGRIGEVGVAGYLLGGGLSYLSAQYGYGTDNVVNFEVVLANASIVNANAISNPDLFLALKGGGNQFGMVTKFTLRTVNIGQVWGGVRFYSSDHASALINATHDFTSNLPDPKAAVIVNAEYILMKATLQFTIFFFYDGPTPPLGIFGAFESIPYEITETKTRSYSDMLQSSDAVTNVPPRSVFYDVSYPSLAGDTGRSVFQAQYDQFTKAIAAPRTLLNGLGVAILTYQPWSRTYIEAGRARGGPNAIAANPAEGDKLYSIYQIEPTFKIQDRFSQQLGRSLSDNFASYYNGKYSGQSGTHADPGTPSHIGPSYMNDAGVDQLVVQQYADYATLAATQKKYDPQGFFTTRTKGYKY